jgi:ribosomal protein S18 acetylase RimI-like enzyme
MVRFPHVTLDTTHIGTWGWDLLEVYEQLQGRIAHVHLSNYDNREHRPPWEGHLPLDALVHRLARDGYQGALSLESNPEALCAGDALRCRAALECALTFCRRHSRMTMDVRLAQGADVDQLAQAHLASWQAAYRGIMPDSVLDRLSIEDAKASWHRNLHNRERVNLVCVVDGAVAGYVAVGPTHDDDENAVQTGEVYGIYLDPAHWNRGLGRILWDAAETELLRRGYQDVMLWTLEANVRARGFYEHLGFQLDDGVTRAFRPQEIGLSEVRYRRQLDPNGESQNG